MAIPHLPSCTFSNHSRSTFLLSIFVTPRPCSSSSSHSRSPSTNSTCLAPGALAWVFALGLKCPVGMTIPWSTSLVIDPCISRTTAGPTVPLQRHALWSAARSRPHPPVSGASNTADTSAEKPSSSTDAAVSPRP